MTARRSLKAAVSVDHADRSRIYLTLRGISSEQDARSRARKMYPTSTLVFVGPLVADERPPLAFEHERCAEECECLECGRAIEVGGRMWHEVSDGHYGPFCTRRCARALSALRRENES